MTRFSDDALRFLYSLGNETRLLDEPVEIMGAVARSLGVYLQASRCAYADVEDDNDQFTIHRDYTSGCLSVSGKYSLDDFGRLAARLMRSGETLVIRDVDAELTPDDGADTFNAIGIKAIICCPLVKPDGLRAMMAVHQIDPRDWTDAEVALVEEVVERCWAIIERAKAQQVARSSQQQFEDLFEYAPDAMLMVDGGNLIHLVNKRCESLFRVHRDDLIGQSASSILPIDRIEADDTSVIAAGDNGQRAPLQATRPDGSTFLIESSLRKIETDSGITKTISVRDVTNRLRLEAELRQSKKMETIGRLVGGIAHDFNNLLTVITNTVQLLLAEQDEASETRGNLELIQDTSYRAAELTHQLLAFSRQQVLKPEVACLNQMVGKIKPLIERLIGEHIDVELKTEAEPALIFVDPNQIGQVLLNLAANARDAMPGGGRLSIATGNRGDRVTLVVEDTGVGIKEEELDRIFDPFFSTKPLGKGTGLGLATVYGIVKQSHGDVEVESQPGSGSRFTILLPASSQAQQPIEQKNSSEGGEERILLVEDDEGVRRVAEQILRSSGYDVAVADSGQRALELLEDLEGLIDLMVTDVIMPGMTGAALVNQVKSRWPEIRVLFTSGYTDDTLGEQGVLSREQNFIPKPFENESLRQAVRKTLDESR